MSKFLKSLCKLLSVESIVTIILTAVFAYMAINGTINSEFVTIYGIIIAFYFSTTKIKKH